MDRYVCVHGHFYQPPRENPWLEAIELQESAHPYHDWNARIAAECYAPNAASRILDDDDHIVRIVNNYSSISFNFGPTLLSWLERHAGLTYQAILDADTLSRERFDGHGSAIAQAYNHMIMPLANARDKRTQILWGIRDFQHRFGRDPEGMWLPETACDLETFEAMAAQGIGFTILSPHQAARFREIGATDWEDTDGGKIDPTRAYRQNLPSGRHIVVFFYDGLVSQAIAFERLLGSGQGFAARLQDGLSAERSWPQLMHVATDGESYGHHHRFGDMALASALAHIEQRDDVLLTNYGAFLEKHPPTHEVEIHENTAWSCVHGVDRWRADCGCHTGGNADWNQKWRAPLRESLDWLRDALATVYEEAGRALFRNPWEARDAYIQVVLDRSGESLELFLERQHVGLRRPEADVQRLKLLELQRQAMLMFTSCGWFFDDLSGIETVQILAYAGRALQLAEDLTGGDLTEEFLGRLEAARSNRPEYPDGRILFEQAVKPAMLDLLTVGAHYAVSGLSREVPETVDVYCYEAKQQVAETLNSGRYRLNLGRVQIRSQITGEDLSVSYAALHHGDHNVSGGVRVFPDQSAHRQAADAARDAFERMDLSELVQVFSREFADRTLTLRSLFEDEQRHFIDLILRENLAGAETSYEQIYRDNEHLIRFLAEQDLPVPEILRFAAERAVNTRFRVLLESSEPVADTFRDLLKQARAEKIQLDLDGLGFALQERLESLAESFRDAPGNVETLRRLTAGLGLMEHIAANVNLWRVQNIYYQLLHSEYPGYRERATTGNHAAREWVERFTLLGGLLRVRIDS